MLRKYSYALTSEIKSTYFWPSWFFCFFFVVVFVVFFGFFFFFFFLHAPCTFIHACPCTNFEILVVMCAILFL